MTNPTASAGLSLLLTLSCPNQPGIVANVSRSLALS